MSKYVVSNDVGMIATEEEWTTAVSLGVPGSIRSYPKLCTTDMRNFRRL